jgi:hypothetical protein
MKIDPSPERLQERERRRRRRNYIAIHEPDKSVTYIPRLWMEGALDILEMSGTEREGAWKDAVACFKWKRNQRHARLSVKQLLIELREKAKKGASPCGIYHAKARGTDQFGKISVEPMTDAKGDPIPGKYQWCWVRTAHLDPKSFKRSSRWLPLEASDS